MKEKTYKIMIFFKNHTIEITNTKWNPVEFYNELEKSRKKHKFWKTTIKTVKDKPRLYTYIFNLEELQYITFEEIE
jgi:hypothetical protein